MDVHQNGDIEEDLLSGKYKNKKMCGMCGSCVQNDIYMLMAYDKNKRDIVKGFSKYDLFQWILKTT